MKDDAKDDLADFTPQIYNSNFGSTTDFSNLTVEVAGFPIKGKAHLYQHAGCVNIVQDKNNNGRVIYYDVDMTAG